MLLQPPTQTHLAGTLAHLTALAAKTTHALLPPLLAHTAVDVQEHGESVLVLNTVSDERAALEILTAIDKADQVRRDELLVLNHELDGLDGSISLARQGEGGGGTVGGNKDLHCVLDKEPGCSKPE